jgi:cytochrome c-type biogenesis protein CcmE
MAEEKLIRNPKLIIGEAEKVEAEVVGADDIVVVTDEEFYTAKEVDDLLKKSGSNYLY